MIVCTQMSKALTAMIHLDGVEFCVYADNSIRETNSCERLIHS